MSTVVRELRQGCCPLTREFTEVTLTGSDRDPGCFAEQELAPAISPT